MPTEVTSVITEVLVGGESTQVTNVVLDVLTAPDLSSTKITGAVLEVLVSMNGGGNPPWQGERLFLPRGWQGAILKWGSRHQGALRRK
jgi:hypothetical protein